MDEMVYVAPSVSPAMLTEALRDTRLHWAYAERLEDTVLTWRDALLNGDVPLKRWDHGRAFGPEMEVSWWRRDEGYEVRAIISTGQPPAVILWTRLDTGGWQAEDDHVALLIGEHDADRPTDVPTWSAARIPRYLPYPVEVSERKTPLRAALVVRVYRAGGIIVTQRLVQVKGV
jgi:hypothetical protein